jgi:AcrR family transcriptional regulator
MAKTPRKAEEIKEIRARILTAALDIIVSEGFINLSMRKLASRLGMTAANIYNYFNNKDEIYILVRAKGFEMLSQDMDKVYEKEKEPHARLEGMIKSYIDFGIRNPDYYKIMFNGNSPKYLDYIGTPMEDVAAEERKSSLRAMEIALATIKDTVRCHDETDLMKHTIKLWIMINGIVTLHNSIGSRQVFSKVDIVIKRITEELINSYR